MPVTTMRWASAGAAAGLAAGADAGAGVVWAPAGAAPRAAAPKSSAETARATGVVWSFMADPRKGSRFGVVDGGRRSVQTSSAPAPAMQTTLCHLGNQ
jgi:mannose/cellobiose epimerase-like protein (N-acyl-D-glucosamine 2-epimerase family)